MIALACPGCGADVPEPELSEFIRFYDGDEGKTRECPGCGAPIYWRMALALDNRDRRQARTWRERKGRAS